MKDIANWALNVATLRGATYADTRIVSQRSRALTTKNGAEIVREKVRQPAAANRSLLRCWRGPR